MNAWRQFFKVAFWTLLLMALLFWAGWIQAGRNTQRRALEDAHQKQLIREVLQEKKHDQ